MAKDKDKKLEEEGVEKCILPGQIVLFDNPFYVMSKAVPIKRLAETQPPDKAEGKEEAE